MRPRAASAAARAEAGPTTARRATGGRPPRAALGSRRRGSGSLPGGRTRPGAPRRARRRPTAQAPSGARVAAASAAAAARPAGHRPGGRRGRRTSSAPRRPTDGRSGRRSRALGPPRPRPARARSCRCRRPRRRPPAPPTRRGRRAGRRARKAPPPFQRAVACRLPRALAVDCGRRCDYDQRVAVTSKPPALDPLDFLALDALLDDEERAIRDTVRRFVRERVLPEIGDWFDQAMLPQELAKELARLGLFGMHLDGYGLPGASSVAYGLTCLELEDGDSGVRSLVSVQGSLAMYAIWRWGSEEQKQRWLPRMAAGEA